VWEGVDDKFDEWGPCNSEWERDKIGAFLSIQKYGSLE